MSWMADRIIKHKWVILLGFILVVILSLLLSRLVEVNYNLMDYLPEDSPSTTGLEILNETFDKAPPNTRILIRDVSIPEALNYKERIRAVEGVAEINWLDDVVNIYQPVEFICEDILKDWYQDNNALYNVLIPVGEDAESLNETLVSIRQIIGDKGAISGESVASSSAQQTAGREIAKVMTFLIPGILIILFFTTSSWFEPLLFLMAIGVSVLINTGTDMPFIGYIIISSVQLGATVDYAILFASRYIENRGFHHKKESMIRTVADTTGSILTSGGILCMAGFMLGTMSSNGIIGELGILIGRGAVLSAAMVLLCLPSLLVIFDKVLQSTTLGLKFIKEVDTYETRKA